MSFDTIVPSSGDPKSKLWFITDAPVWEDTIEKKLFSDSSGRMFREILLRNGIIPEECYITSISPRRVPDDNIVFAKNEEEISLCVGEIIELAKRCKPNVIGILANPGMGNARPMSDVCGKRGVHLWRGSIIPLADEPSIKCIPTFHPAYVAKAKDELPIFDADIKRIAQDSLTPDFKYPNYKFHINTDIEYLLSLLSKSDAVCSCDIETSKSGLTLLCIGFAVRVDGAVHAFVLPFNKSNEKYIRNALESPAIKVFHNGNAFDVPVLTQVYDYTVNKYLHDTIIQANIINPAFEKSLAFLTSIYTRQPYYKTEGRAELPSDEKSWGDKVDRESLYIYNARDCCVTLEIHEEQIKEIKDDKLTRIYDFSMQAAYCAMDISANGLAVNRDRLDLIRSTLEARVLEQYSQLWFITDSDPNVRSSKDMPFLLYEKLGLPKKYSFNKQTKKKELTTGEDALIELVNFCKTKFDEMKTQSGRMSWMYKLAALQLILRIRGDEKILSSYINIEFSRDNRARSIFKSHGTETGRWSAAKYVDKTGLNLQTMPRDSVEVVE